MLQEREFDPQFDQEYENDEDEGDFHKFLSASKKLTTKWLIKDDDLSDEDRDDVQTEQFDEEIEDSYSSRKGTSKKSKKDDTTAESSGKKRGQKSSKKPETKTSTTDNMSQRPAQGNDEDSIVKTSSLSQLKISPSKEKHKKRTSI